jgi:hypothetical protein
MRYSFFLVVMGNRMKEDKMGEEGLIGVLETVLMGKS